MSDKEQRVEVAALVRRAIEGYGMSAVTTSPDNATRLTVTLRPPNSSRVFVAEVIVTEAREV